MVNKCNYCPDRAFKLIKKTDSKKGNRRIYIFKQCCEENEQEVSRDVEQGWGGARDCGPVWMGFTQS